MEFPHAFVLSPIALVTMLLCSTTAVATESPSLDTRRTEEIRQLIESVLADADTRSSLLETNLTGGWDGHFFLASSDGNYLLEAGAQMQIRYMHSFRDNSNADDSRGGFQNRRIKLTFEGHLIDPSLEYLVSVNVISTLSLSDGYIKKSFENGYSLRIGQFKPPFLREELLSSKRMLAVERSVVNDNGVWNQDRSLGVEVAYGNDDVHASVMIHNGFNRDGMVAMNEDTEYAIAGRVEFLLAGSFKQFGDAPSWRGEAFAALLGTAFNFEKDEHGTTTGPEEKRLAWTADLTLEGDGSNFSVAILAQQSETNGSPDLHRYGVVVQGGTFITDNLEVFGRFEWGDLDMPGVSELSIITFGCNRYFSKHTLKWTTDIGFGLNEVDANWVQSNSAWLADAPGESGQIVLRSQIQLLF